VRGLKPLSAKGRTCSIYRCQLGSSHIRHVLSAVKGDFFGDEAEFDQARCDQGMLCRNTGPSMFPRDGRVVVVRMME
jgi:hypothetical protein